MYNFSCSFSHILNSVIVTNAIRKSDQYCKMEEKSAAVENTEQKVDQNAEQKADTEEENDICASDTQHVANTMQSSQQNASNSSPSVPETSATPPPAPAAIGGEDERKAHLLKLLYAFHSSKSADEVLIALQLLFGWIKTTCAVQIPLSNQQTVVPVVPLLSLPLLRHAKNEFVQCAQIKQRRQPHVWTSVVAQHYTCILQQLLLAIHSQTQAQSVQSQISQNRLHNVISHSKRPLKLPINLGANRLSTESNLQPLRTTSSHAHIPMISLKHQARQTETIVNGTTSMQSRGMLLTKPSIPSNLQLQNSISRGPSDFSSLSSHQVNTNKYNAAAVYSNKPGASSSDSNNLSKFKAGTPNTNSTSNQQYTSTVSASNPPPKESVCFVDMTMRTAVCGPDEDHLYIPVRSISKVMKHVLPKDGKIKISDDAKGSIFDCNGYLIYFF